MDDYRQPDLTPEPRRTGLNPSRWDRRTLVAVVAASAVTIGTTFVPWGIKLAHQRSDSDAYGRDPVAAATELKVCEHPQRDGATATCATTDGGAVDVLTSTDADEQNRLIATLAYRLPGLCLAVLKGVVISAVDENTLAAAVGAPQEFVERQDGYLLCPDHP